MSETPLEIDGENKYVEWAHSQKLICEKVKFPTAGYPDRLTVLPLGIHIWIEFKRKGETPTNIQYYRMMKLREQGAFVGWTDDHRIAIRAVQTVLDATRLPETSHPFIAFAEQWRTLFGSWFGKNLNLFSCT